MVHKKFEKTASNRVNIVVNRAPRPDARNYLDEMAPVNGFVEVDSDVIRLRDAFRDEVSKRMGELLLKGQTMLDEYCETCNGIIMEDRAQVRRCVTCELYREKAGQVIAEIPLHEEELKEAVDEVPAVKTPVMVEKKVTPKVASTKKAEKAATKAEIKEIKTENSENNDVLEVAKDAVLRKIRWASEQLDMTTETSRIVDFLAVIQKSAETLSALNL